MATSKKTSRSAKTDHVLDDAKNVLAAARKYQKQFAAADKGKRHVRVGAELLKGLSANLALYDKARGDQARGKSAKESATAIEVNARVPVYETLIDIRDDVATTHRADKAIAKAFGVGTRINRDSTPGLLKAAAALLSLVAGNKALSNAAKDAGVNAARLAQLKRAHEALAKAQEGQISAIASARTDGVDRQVLFRKISSDVAFIRKVASTVFRREPKTLSAFASVRPRTPKRSKPADSPPAATNT